MRRIPAALAMCGLVVAMACQDQVVAPSALELGNPELADLPPGIHAVLAIPGLETAAPSQITRVRLHLVEVAQEQTVASWQGELRYDAEGMEILDAAFADGLVGAWHLVEPGRLRFAGIALEGLKGTAALELTVRAGRVPRRGDFTVKLEEVVGREGFAVLTGQVVQGQETRVVAALRPS